MTDFACALGDDAVHLRTERIGYPTALADAFDEVEISMPPGDLLADEHAAVVHRVGPDIKAKHQ